jgi:hypothetical protein
MLFTLATGSPTLAAIGAGPGDVLFPGFDADPDAPVVVFPAGLLGLGDADPVDALKCDFFYILDIGVSLAKPQQVAQTVGDPAVSREVGIALFNKGPESVTAGVELRVSASDAVFTSWRAASGDQCIGTAVPPLVDPYVDCTGEFEVVGLRMRSELPVGTEQWTRTLDIACFEPGIHSVAVQASVAAFDPMAAMDTVPGNEWAEVFFNVVCTEDPVTGLIFADGLECGATTEWSMRNPP